MGVSEKLRLLESIVKVPLYTVVGHTGRYIVYVSTEEGVLSLWSLNLDTGRRLRLTKQPIHSVAKPSPKSKSIIYTRDVSKGRELQKPFTVDVERGVEEVYADTPPMRFFGMVYDGEKLIFSASTEAEMGLFLAEKGGYEKLTKLDTLAIPSDIGGEYVVGYGIFGRDPRLYELFIYNISTGEFKVYTPREGSTSKTPRIYGTKILFESNFEGGNRLYIYDIETNELRRAEMGYSGYREYEPVEHVDYGWTEEGRIWVIGERNGRSKPFIDGLEVSAPTGFINSMTVVQNKAYYTASSLTTPPKIYEADTTGYRVLLDNVLPRELVDRVGQAMFTKYKSLDGLEIPMYVIESPIAPKPGPAVIYVHGGPWSEVVDRWSTLIIGLVVSGYHVLAPNFRGSTGYGEEFRVKDIGDPGGGDLADVVAARDWGIEEGLVDKVAIMGYSYGGYMTYLALGRHPELWDAGVAGAGVVDWVEMYGLSDALFKKFIEVLFDGKNEELFRERSPITYVENIEAPLCIIHPQNDTRTPLKPVLRYMGSLLEAGKTFEAHIIPDMGHIIATTEDIARILLPAILFLDKQLKKPDKT